MFREQQPCVGVFVSNYDGGAGAAWPDCASCDVFTRDADAQTLSHMRSGVGSRFFIDSLIPLPL